MLKGHFSLFLEVHFNRLKSSKSWVSGDLLLRRSCSTSWRALWGEGGVGGQVVDNDLCDQSHPGGHYDDYSDLGDQCDPKPYWYYPPCADRWAYYQKLCQKIQSRASDCNSLEFPACRASQRDLLAAQLCIWVFGLLALWVFPNCKRTSITPEILKCVLP